jgi:hypothetical protein
MAPVKTIQYIGSFEINTAHIPRYFVRPSEEIELRIVGSNFTISMFERLPHKVLDTNDQQVTAYILVYQYHSRNVAGCIIHQALFIGGKPEIHFLYENEQYPKRPIVEFRLSRLRNKPTLILENTDVENDPERSHQNNLSSNSTDKSSLGGGECNVPALDQ